MRRKKPITVYAHPSDLAHLKAKAQESGQSFTGYVIACAVGRSIRPVPHINQTQWQELSRLAANLNQLARSANAGRVDLDPAIIQQTQAQLKAVRAALVGNV